MQGNIAAILHDQQSSRLLTKLHLLQKIDCYLDNGFFLFIQEFFLKMKSSDKTASSTSNGFAASNILTHTDEVFSTRSLFTDTKSDFNACNQVKNQLTHLIQSKNPKLKLKFDGVLNGTIIDCNDSDLSQCLCQKKNEVNNGFSERRNSNCEKFDSEKKKFATTNCINTENIEHRSKFNRKHVKLKPCAVINSLDKPRKGEEDTCVNSDLGASNNGHIGESDSHLHLNSQFYVMQSIERLGLCKYGLEPCASEILSDTCTSLLDNVDAELDLVFEEKGSSSRCQPKKMRSSPKDRIVKSTSSEESIEVKSDDCFKCEWHECKRTFAIMDKFTKHVKKEHIQTASKNDVFVCLWRDCRFSNQPSCSYKWLSKHVFRHCDMKPFKCVIFGCDMAFVTQSGLARHVPTHFNEGNVRRACVKTNCVDSTQGWESPKVNKNLFLKLSSVDDFSESSRDSTIGEEHFSPQLSGLTVNNRNGDSFSQRNYNELKKKIEISTCNPLSNHGYIGKLLRIEHKVVGKRTLATGEVDVLLAPSVKTSFRHDTIWLDAHEFAEHNSSHVDVPIQRLSRDAVAHLYESSITSRRRKRTRK